MLCAPPGGEGRRLYRPLWVLANALADRGIAVLRYDHPGTGDSLPLPQGADQWAAWLSGVEQAAAFARTAAGAQRLVVGGIRLGASLAAITASRTRADGLLLLAPIASGATWVRELQLAMRLAGAPRSPDGSVEIDGLFLSAASVEAIQRFDLRGAACAAPHALVATRGATPGDLSGIAETVRGLRFDGYEDLFREAHVNSVPQRVFEASADWLIETFPSPSTKPAPRIPPAAVLTAGDWTERSVTFGDGLQGVLCLPTAASSAAAVIFCGTAADPRAGIGDFAAQTSRGLAARGVAALRFDFSGIGESPAREGWRSHIFEEPRVAELVAAADLLGAYGHSELVLTGICSGAYHALQAAIADPRFAKVFAVNPRLVWCPHYRLTNDAVTDAPPHRIRLRSILRPGAWRRMLTGEVRARPLIAGLLRRASSHLGVARLSAEARCVRDGVRRFGARGGRLLVLCGAHDDYLDELDANFGAGGRWLARQRGVTLAFREGLDHALFSVESRASVAAALLSFVEKRQPPRKPLAADLTRTSPGRLQRLALAVRRVGAYRPMTPSMRLPPSSKR